MANCRGKTHKGKTCLRESSFYFFSKIKCNSRITTYLIRKTQNSVLEFVPMYRLWISKKKSQKSYRCLEMRATVFLLKKRAHDCCMDLLFLSPGFFFFSSQEVKLVSTLSNLLSNSLGFKMRNGCLFYCFPCLFISPS